jgi:hypothetical protein
MSNLVVRNSQSAYYAPANLVNRVDTLDLTAAFSALHEPAANTIALWADQGTGVYPLTTTRGATDNSTIHIAQGTGQMSTVDSIEFTPNPTPTGLHQDSVTTHLWFNGFDLQTGGGGNVTGPGISVAGTVCQFADATGAVIEEAPLVNRTYIDGVIGPTKALTLDGAADSAAVKIISPAVAIQGIYGDTGNTGATPGGSFCTGGQVQGVAMQASSATGAQLQSMHDSLVPELPFKLQVNMTYAAITPGDIPQAIGGTTALQASSTGVDIMGNLIVSPTGFILSSGSAFIPTVRVDNIVPNTGDTVTITSNAGGHPIILDPRPGGAVIISPGTNGLETDLISNSNAGGPVTIETRSANANIQLQPNGTGIVDVASPLKALGPVRYGAAGSTYTDSAHASFTVNTDFYTLDFSAVPPSTAALIFIYALIKDTTNGGLGEYYFSFFAYKDALSVITTQPGAFNLNNEIPLLSNSFTSAVVGTNIVFTVVAGSADNQVLQCEIDINIAS